MLATGNRAVLAADETLRKWLTQLPTSVATRIDWAADWHGDAALAGALIEGDAATTLAATQAIAALGGAIVPVQAATPDALARDPHAYRLSLLLEEVSTSINTTAAGGNASLMAIS